MVWGSSFAQGLKKDKENADGRYMRQQRDDAGVTLAELLVVIAILGILLAFTAWGVNAWATASAFKGAPSAIQSVLRSTQERAITEGKSFCVQFDTAADTYTVYRYACTDPDRVKVSGPFGTGSGWVHLSGPVFRDSADVAQTGVTFTAHGSAWPGQVSVVRDGTVTPYTVHVDSLTGRVWIT